VLDGRGRACPYPSSTVAPVTSSKFSVAGCTLTVCRDCCCGSLRKHPTVDHDGQLDVLRAAMEPAHRVRTSLCLDACSQSNVVVVHPPARARRAGARPVWFGLVLDDTVVDDLVKWVGDGGPGVAELPAVLELSVIQPPASS
jgi:(2Fe-2S) ferredoxin